MAASVTLTEGTKYQDVTGADSVTTGPMGGTVSVVVVGLYGTRAQRCAGGFQTLDDVALRVVGPIQAIIAAAPYQGAYDVNLLKAWVGRNQGSGRTYFANNNNVRIDLSAARRGAPLFSCIQFV